MDRAPVLQTRQHHSKHHWHLVPYLPYPFLSSSTHPHPAINTKPQQPPILGTNYSYNNPIPRPNPTLSPSTPSTSAHPHPAFQKEATPPKKPHPIPRAPDHLDPYPYHLPAATCYPPPGKRRHRAHGAPSARRRVTA